MTTLKEIFGISTDKQKISGGKWDNLREKLDKEIKEIKWVKFTPDLVKNIGELLNIKISDLFISSWKKVKAIEDALAESRQMPEKTIKLELDDHTIESELQPYIEIRIKNIPAPKRINFNVKLSFNIKGFILNIKNGLVKEIGTGSCEVKGTLECEKIILAEKESGPIELPLTITVTG